jgi:hypothetical protein
MPTPDPSLIPAIVTASAALFTSNWSVVLLAVVALIGIIVLPAMVAGGGLRLAVKTLRKVFHTPSSS